MVILYGFGRLIVRVLVGGLITVMAFILLYRFVPVPGTTLMALRSFQGEELSYTWAPLSKIADNLVLAAIAGEDVKFCQHKGFDLGEIKAAYEDYKAGKGLRGASTISQQTAKNAFLWPGRGPVRKVVEAGFTLPMEVTYSKRRIMEVYLNVAEFDEGAFGVQAAAQHYFGVDARDLTTTQAARLAAILPAPKTRSALCGSTTAPSTCSFGRVRASM